MLVKKYQDVEMEEIHADGAEHVFIQWLIDEKLGDNFAMRRFTLLKQGHTPYHIHDWEHEVYVLNGEGALVDEQGNEHPLLPGTFAYVEPNIKHQFLNKGDTDFVFLCMIPFQ